MHLKQLLVYVLGLTMYKSVILYRQQLKGVETDSVKLQSFVCY